MVYLVYDVYEEYELRHKLTYKLENWNIKKYDDEYSIWWEQTPKSLYI